MARKKGWRVLTTTRAKVYRVRGLLVERLQHVTHVWPASDLRLHKGNYGAVCWCQPKIERAGCDTLITHNSMDGRELIERHGLQ